MSDPAAYDRMVPTGFNPDGYINVDSIAADQEFFISTGALPQRVDLATVIDQQYVDYAVGRLGRYQPERPRRWIPLGPFAAQTEPFGA